MYLTWYTSIVIKKPNSPKGMVLLHGFIKKTRKTPGEDLELARSNKSKHQRGLR